MAQNVGAALLRARARELAVAAKAAAFAIQAERACATQLLGRASRVNAEDALAELAIRNDVKPPLGLKSKTSSQLGKALARWEVAPGSLDPLLFAVVPVAEAEHALWRLLHAIEAAAPAAEADMVPAAMPAVVEDVPADNTDACADLGNFVGSPLPRSVDDHYSAAPPPAVMGPAATVGVLRPGLGAPFTPLMPLPATSAEESAAPVGLPASVTEVPSSDSQDSSAPAPSSSHGRSRWVGAQPSGRHSRQLAGRSASGVAELREAKHDRRADEPGRRRPSVVEFASAGARAAQPQPLREELRGLHWADDVARWRREAVFT